MPCALCGDIIPSQVARCPACGAWARRRDFRAVGVAVFMLLGFNAFIAFGAGISLLRMNRPLAELTRDGYDAVATAQALAPYADVFTISTVLGAITGVLYLAWLWRAAGQAAGPRPYPRRWVVLGWLIPVVNLVLPPRIVHDVWVSSGRFSVAGRHSVGVLVGAWWVSLLAAVGLGQAFPNGAESLPEARFSVHLGVAAAACHALAAALCMVSVFQITRLQLDRPVAT
ncbi:DUF4328 domain-containing protein [Thermomonospora cellulosilytica]|uniref:DUF4328 domain-containing protein n=1 Tax=Thermomonospora cellulosilytica TaxID=1411118 RepID=A0A7W3MY80_9ACTN|nr:DUF4328 domain-containing protein [Thermomonospora cellulosilytica]MBA9004054.1 hypothetical protein [Thermomonospora cellulosilytica]